VQETSYLTHSIVASFTRYPVHRSMCLPRIGKMEDARLITNVKGDDFFETRCKFKIILVFNRSDFKFMIVVCVFPEKLSSS